MEIYVKISFSSIFSFSSSFQTWFYQLRWCYPYHSFKHSKVMTSRIMLHIEYLIQTYYIRVLMFQSKLLKNLALMASFNTVYWWFVIVAYFFGPPCMLQDCRWRTMATIRARSVDLTTRYSASWRIESSFEVTTQLQAILFNTYSMQDCSLPCVLWAWLQVYQVS